MNRRAVVTGLGFVTSIGNDRNAVSASLRELRGGIARVDFAGNPNVPVKVAGTVKDFTVESPSWRDWRYPARYELPRETLRSLAPHGVYALCAAEQAIADAGLTADALRDGATGLYCASAGSAFLLHHHLAQMHAARFERGNPMGVVMSIAGTLNFNLAAHYGIRGAVGGFVAACASSSHALGCALDDIRLGRQDRMLVVGAEEVNAETILPFAAMRALSTNPDPASASRPFDTARDGFVAAGGAVCMILEAEETARRRHAPIYAELAGWGQAADGYNVAVSHPEGAGLADAMRRTLADARVAPADIDYVNAHATSTPVGDLTELASIKRVFGDHARKLKINAPKSMLGHTCWSAPAVETVAAILQMQAGKLHRSVNIDEIDPAVDLDVCREGNVDVPIRTIMKNSFGFGGIDCVSILRRFDG